MCVCYFNAYFPVCNAYFKTSGCTFSCTFRYFSACTIENLTITTCLSRRSELKLPPENVYGKQMKNGSWDGIMGLMARKEVDVTSVELTMDSTRSEAVDYIVPLINDRYECVYFDLL